MVEPIGNRTDPERPAEGYEDGRLVHAARKVEDMGHRAGEKIEGAKHRIKETVDRAREKAGELREKSMGEMVDDTRDFVRRHPGRSVLISLGVGVLLGAFLRRR